MTAARLMIISAAGVLAAGLAVLAAPTDRPQEIPFTGANDPGEPIAEAYSFERAVSFLDHSSADWAQARGCVTCHTNGVSMLARAALGPSEPLSASMDFARGYLDRYLVDDEAPSGQHGAIEGLVATTAFLAIAEARLGQPPSAAVERGFDHLWAKQAPSGVWTDWLKCNWPPYESDDHFGPTLVAIAAGGLPDAQFETPAARRGLERLRTYLRDAPAANLHQRAMLLWASTRLDGVLTAEGRASIIDELTGAQLAGGGWPMAALADASWTHDSGAPQDPAAGAYATALAVVVLDAAGAEPAAADAGRAWLRAHQRASGRWFNRSPRRDRHHYLSHAASALAVMALRADATDPAEPAE